MDPDNDLADDPGDELDDELDDGLLLPWYYSWWRVGVLASALTIGAVGMLAFAVTGKPGGSSVDVRFLQDMRSHHDQAVQLSLSYLRKADSEPLLQTIAAEILLSQQQETGVMVEILRSFGVAEENSTGTAMEWMDQPVPLERMPGMASEAEVERLDAATGAEAADLFARLMVAHHEGGVHMAEYAAEHAESQEIRDLAARMATAQNHEITDLTQLREG